MAFPFGWGPVVVTDHELLTVKQVAEEFQLTSLTIRPC